MLNFIDEIKKIRVTNEGVYVLDEDLKKQINKKKLSASAINSFYDSPGEWVLSTFIEPELRLEEPIYFARGHWFHSIMEEHFSRELTNIKNLKEDFTNVTKGTPKYTDVPKDGTKYIDLVREQDNRDWIQSCLKGFMKLAKDTDFYDKKVATLYNKGESKKAVEYFFMSKFDGVKLPVLGFVDCIFEDKGGLRIIDWKTGKYWKGDEGYEFQQTLYAMALEKQGLKVSSAALVFPIGTDSGPVIEEINVNKPEVIEKVMKKMKAVDKELDECKNNDYFFPFRRFRWNSWETFLTGNGNARKPQIDEGRFFALAEIDIK